MLKKITSFSQFEMYCAVINQMVYIGLNFNLRIK